MRQMSVRMHQHKEKTEKRDYTISAAVIGICVSVLISGCSLADSFSRWNDGSSGTDSGWESASTGNSGTEATGDGSAAADTVPGGSEGAAGSTASSADAAEGSDHAGTVEDGDDETPDGEFAEDTENLYAYGTLSGEEQKVYRQVMYSIRNRLKVKVSTLDQEVLDKVYDCVTADHPELFFISGYRYTTSRIADVVTSLSFEGTYTVTAEEQNLLQSQLDGAVQNFLADLPEGTDDYGRVKYCFDKIVRETEYVPDAENNQNILSVFLTHESVCNGYAKALQYLCREVGIPCLFVSGTVSGQGHAWNVAQLDGDWYQVDVTWGDPQFDDTVTEEDRQIAADWINYDYLCVTTADIEKTHTMKDTYPVPVCTALSDNYYMRAGTYMTEYNPQQISASLKQGQADGTGIASMRFADDELFRYAKNRLIDEQVIYQYLPGITSIHYTTSENLGTLTIFL